MEEVSGGAVLRDTAVRLIDYQKCPRLFKGAETFGTLITYKILSRAVNS